MSGDPTLVERNTYGNAFKDKLCHFSDNATKLYNGLCLHD